MSKRLLTAATIGCATLLLSGTAFAQSGAATTRATEVDGVTIVANADVRLTMAVGGDMAPDVVVTSAPIGLNCGAAMFQYTPKENRQCWLWVRRNRPVVLTAQSLGRYGVDWKVEWVGCEPLANGAACQVSPRNEMEVAAVFSRLTP